MTSDPRTHKRLGRKVTNFNQDVWSNACGQIALIANYEKFAQNALMHRHLLDTGDRMLAEASPFDTIWGTGFDASHSSAAIPAQWRGDNLLGSTLMEVRRLLRSNLPRPTAARANVSDATLNHGTVLELTQRLVRACIHNTTTPRRARCGQPTLQQITTMES